MTNEFDRNCPHGHTTRNGLKAEIVRDDLSGIYPILAVITQEAGEHTALRYTSEGELVMGMPNNHNLINAPAPKRNLEAWVNFYPDGSTCSWPTKNQADALVAAAHRIACLHVTGEEGDGL